MLDHEKFIRTWQKAAGVAEVATKLGIPIVRCYKTADKMRRKGVPLKKFSRGRVPADWPRLAEIAKEVA